MIDTWARLKARIHTYFQNYGVVIVNWRAIDLID